jgi:hypothetical protein
MPVATQPDRDLGADLQQPVDPLGIAQFGAEFDEREHDLAAARTEVRQPQSVVPPGNFAAVVRPGFERDRAAADDQRYLRAGRRRVRRESAPVPDCCGRYGVIGRQAAAPRVVGREGDPAVGGCIASNSSSSISTRSKSNAGGPKARPLRKRESWTAWKSRTATCARSPRTGLDVFAGVAESAVDHAGDEGHLADRLPVHGFG